MIFWVSLVSVAMVLFSNLILFIWILTLFLLACPRVCWSSGSFQRTHSSFHLLFVLVLLPVYLLVSVSSVYALSVTVSFHLLTWGLAYSSFSRTLKYVIKFFICNVATWSWNFLLGLCFSGYQRFGMLYFHFHLILEIFTFSFRFL